MKLYHGTTIEIAKIDLEKSKPNKDFDKTEKCMKVSQAEFQNMKEEIVKDLISRLMEEKGFTMDKAFDAVYTSRLFEKLNNPKTGLFFQSSGYVYSFLTSELGM